MRARDVFDMPSAVERKDLPMTKNWTRADKDEPTGGGSPGPLWDRPRSPSDTRSEAARLIAREAPLLRRRVLELLRAAGPSGATDEQIQIELGMAANTERPRRVELLRAGLVKDSGRRAPVKSGRLAAVWVAS